MLDTRCDPDARPFAHPTDDLAPTPAGASEPPDTAGGGAPTDPRPAPPSVAWVGRVLDGRYRIDAPLAEGGFGAVYRGTQLAVDRPVAIKLLHDRLARSERHAARFRQEARALAQLSHPGLVQLIDFGAVPGDDTLYLVMELLEGDTFAALLAAEGPLDPDRVIDLGVAVLDALVAAHDRGVIHRDLTPSNLVITRQGDRDVVKLVDFGIAKVLASDGAGLVHTQAGTVLGSPRYVSPEQLADLAITPKSDVYSLGAVLYELLLGRPPFTRDTLRAYVAAHLNDAPDPPVRDGVPVSGRLVHTLRRFLAKDPSGRPNARHAAALLESCRGEGLIPATSGRAAPPAARPAPAAPVDPGPPDPAQTYADAMASRREGALVGRHAELACFERLLDPGDGLRVFAVHGPGGVGKTTLLAACCDRARARGRSVTWVDGAELASLTQLLSVTFAPILAAPPDLLVIDRLEHAWGIVDGLRDGILPRLPATTRVLLAGRRELAWARRPGLRGMVLERELDNLTTPESLSLLTGLGVPSRLRAHIIDEAGGHPLSLALIADLLSGRVGGDRPPTGERFIDSLAAASLHDQLARALVEQVPSGAHRRGLLAAALVMRLNEDDLHQVIPGDEAPTVRRWLAGLSCTRIAPLASDRGAPVGGIELHELTRRVIVRDARIQAPSMVGELIDALGTRAMKRMRTASDDAFPVRVAEASHILAHLTETPYDPIAFDFSVQPTEAQPHHWPSIEELLARFEGPRAVDTLRAWRGPHCEVVVVCEDDVVLGFAAGLRLDTAPAELVALDPGTAALARVLFDERGLPRALPSYYFRFWSGPDHHLPSRTQTRIFGYLMRMAMLKPDLAALISAHHPPAYWHRLRDFAAHELFEAAAFEVDGRAFLPFGRDFSRLSRRDWLIEHFERMFSVRHVAPPALPPERDAHA